MISGSGMLRQSPGARCEMLHHENEKTAQRTGRPMSGGLDNRYGLGGAISRSVGLWSRWLISTNTIRNTSEECGRAFSASVAI